MCQGIFGTDFIGHIKWSRSCLCGCWAGLELKLCISTGCQLKTASKLAVLVTSLRKSGKLSDGGGNAVNNSEMSSIAYKAVILSHRHLKHTLIIIYVSVAWLPYWQITQSVIDWSAIHLGYYKSLLDGYWHERTTHIAVVLAIRSVSERRWLSPTQ